MDPLDREKPWGAVGQLVLLTIVIGLIYVVFRFAVVVPDRGWQAIGAATFVGVILYYVLAFRWTRKRRFATQPGPKRTLRQAAMMALLVIGLTAPIWVLLYFVWRGGWLWN